MGDDRHSVDVTVMLLWGVLREIFVWRLAVHMLEDIGSHKMMMVGERMMVVSQ